jgi:hypothetical protein
MGGGICPVEELYFLKRKVERLKVEEVQLSCSLDSRYASGSSGMLETANFIQDYQYVLWVMALHCVC